MHAEQEVVPGLVNFERMLSGTLRRTTGGTRAGGFMVHERLHVGKQVFFCTGGILWLYCLRSWFRVCGYHERNGRIRFDFAILT